MTEVEGELRDLIRSQGPLPFHRFMELALFSPRGGYYTRPHIVGPRGDFFTSPAAHPLFGVLLALQLEQVWELLGHPSPFTVLEPGGGDGLLCRDILSSLRVSNSPLWGALRYVILDPTPVMGDAAASFPDKAHRIRARSMSVKGIEGCILSNELLDAFPVHRFQVHQGRLLEVYVTLQDGHLAETLEEPSTPHIAQRLKALEIPLAEGLHGEVCLALENWVQEAADALDRGFVLTIDYGGTAGELYSSARVGGTLRCYYQHTPSSSPYVRVGRQDITAHVDFSSLMRLGEATGLETLGVTTQRQFLHNLGFQAFLHALSRRSLPQREYLANRMGMEELVRPSGLGGFKVLAQGKGVGKPELYGFLRENSLRQRLLTRPEEVPLPLLTPQHTPLLEGRYPHQAFDWEHLWEHLQGHEETPPERQP